MNAGQLRLDLSPISEPERVVGLTLDERFDAFHATNPHVADAIETLAAQWLSRHAKVGIKAVMERLRWESGLSTHGEVWRLNNSYTSRYARMMLDRRPDWAGRIEVRALASERAA